MKKLIIVLLVLASCASPAKYKSLKLKNTYSNRVYEKRYRKEHPVPILWKEFTVFFIAWVAISDIK